MQSFRVGKGGTPDRSNILRSTASPADSHLDDILEHDVLGPMHPSFRISTAAASLPPFSAVDPLSNRPSWWGRFSSGRGFALSRRSCHFGAGDGFQAPGPGGSARNLYYCRNNGMMPGEIDLHSNSSKTLLRLNSVRRKSDGGASTGVRLAQNPQTSENACDDTWNRRPSSPTSYTTRRSQSPVRGVLRNGPSAVARRSVSPSDSQRSASASDGGDLDDGTAATRTRRTSQGVAWADCIIPTRIRPESNIQSPTGSALTDQQLSQEPNSREKERCLNAADDDELGGSGSDEKDKLTMSGPVSPQTSLPLATSMEHVVLPQMQQERIASVLENDTMRKQYCPPLQTPALVQWMQPLKVDQIHTFEQERIGTQPQDIAVQSPRGGDVVGQSQELIETKHDQSYLEAAQARMGSKTVNALMEFSEQQQNKADAANAVDMTMKAQHILSAFQGPKSPGLELQVLRKEQKSVELLCLNQPSTFQAERLSDSLCADATLEWGSFGYANILQDGHSAMTQRDDQQSLAENKSFVKTPSPINENFETLNSKDSCQKSGHIQNSLSPNQAQQQLIISSIPAEGGGKFIDVEEIIIGSLNSGAAKSVGKVAGMSNADSLPPIAGLEVISDLCGKAAGHWDVSKQKSASYLHLTSSNPDNPEDPLGLSGFEVELLPCL